MDATNQEHLTIESFFLSDYQRQRERIAELEAKVEEYEHNARTAAFGCFDLRQVAKCVKVDTECTSNYRREGTFTIEELEEVSKMDNEHLKAWAFKTHYNPSHKGDRWYACKPITIEEHTYQYTLRFVESRSDVTFVTDGKCDSRLVKLADTPAIGGWVREAYRDEAIQEALDCVRDDVQDTLRYLREK